MEMNMMGTTHSIVNSMISILRVDTSDCSLLTSMATYNSTMHTTVELRLPKCGIDPNTFMKNSRSTNGYLVSESAQQMPD